MSKNISPKRRPRANAVLEWRDLSGVASPWAGPAARLHQAARRPRGPRAPFRPSLPTADGADICADNGRADSRPRRRRGGAPEINAIQAAREQVRRGARGRRTRQIDVGKRGERTDGGGSAAQCATGRWR